MVIHPSTSRLRPRLSAPSGRTNLSVWRATAPAIRETKLCNNVRTDICVVGAGIAGLTTAYLLAREGQSVVLIEKNQLGQGETAHTSAHLSNEIDAGYREIERLHGEEGARLVAQSHSSAITQIESIVHEEAIDCGFERLDGYLFLGEKESKQNLHEEFEAAQRAGIKTKELERPQLDLKLGYCLQFPQQAQFHPLEYIAGLADAITRLRGRIYSETEAKEIKSGKRAGVTTTNGSKISAAAVVVATNTPINDRVKMHTKQAAYRTYMIGIPISVGSIPKALYWDTGDPFHYVRILQIKNNSKVREFVIIGGEDHKTGQAEDIENRFTHLLTWGRSYFSDLAEPEFLWSGQVINSIDGLAFIGRNPGDEPNVYIVTGDSGMGLTHGTIAGILLKDLILGRDNHWATLYDPSRKSLRAAVTFAEENLNVAAQYAKWVTPAEVSVPEEVEPGVGAIVRDGLSKLAVYRDGAGKLYAHSAVCPHLGCIVAWNPTERSWDCPCHGSRFNSHGEILNGPAVGSLKPASFPS